MKPLMPPIPDPPRCSGHCCACVSVGETREDVLKYAKADPDTLCQDPKLTAVGRAVIRDNASFAAGLRYLGTFARNPLSGRPEPDGRSRPYWACTHLEPGGDCGRYSSRPVICQEFPYNGRVCEFWQCTGPAGTFHLWRSAMSSENEEREIRRLYRQAMRPGSPGAVELLQLLERAGYRFQIQEARGGYDVTVAHSGGGWDVSVGGLTLSEALGKALAQIIGQVTADLWEPRLVKLLSLAGSAVAAWAATFVKGRS